MSQFQETNELKRPQRPEPLLMIQKFKEATTKNQDTVIGKNELEDIAILTSAVQKLVIAANPQLNELPEYPDYDNTWGGMINGKIQTTSSRDEKNLLIQATTRKDSEEESVKISLSLSQGITELPQNLQDVLNEIFGENTTRSSARILEARNLYAGFNITNVSVQLAHRDSRYTLNATTTLEGNNSTIIATHSLQVEHEKFIYNNPTVTYYTDDQVNQNTYEHNKILQSVQKKSAQIYLKPAIQLMIDILQQV